MPRNRRLLHSLTVLLVVLLGLMAAPAGSATQDDDVDTTAPAEIVTPDEDSSGTNDADQDNEDPPDCDEEGWRIVTTEDGDGFASEDHCDDHVADNGADSLVLVGAEEEDEYVAVTMTEAIGPSCKTTVTLVGGQDGQVVQAHITAASDAFFQPTFIPANGETTQSAVIRQGDSLVSGTAEFLDADWNPTEETLPVYLPAEPCA